MDPPTLTRLQRCSSFCKCQGSINIVGKESIPVREDEEDTENEGIQERIVEFLRGFIIQLRRFLFNNLN